MQALLSRCPVCGLSSENTVCKRCNTILAWEKASCPQCGKMYSQAYAVCDACNGMHLGRQGNQADFELRNLMMAAGVSREAASMLYGQGFHEFADLVKLALPQKAVWAGLHKTIARRMMMDEYVKRGREDWDAGCPICSAPFDPETGLCQKCRFSPIPEHSERWIKDRIAQVTGKVEDLCNDPDFLAMPESEKKQMLDEIGDMLEPVQDEESLVDELESVFGGLDEEEQVRQQFIVQIEAWRNKGFDVSLLEELLEADLEDFRKRCVQIVRAQVLKAQDEEKFCCPLCDAYVSAEAKECPNCGAMFE